MNFEVAVNSERNPAKKLVPEILEE
jgi:hypothetical protein